MKSFVNTFKKTISLFTTFCLLISLAPIETFAIEEESTFSDEVVESTNEDLSGSDQEASANEDNVTENEDPDTDTDDSSTTDTEENSEPLPENSAEAELTPQERKELRLLEKLNIKFADPNLSEKEKEKLLKKLQKIQKRELKQEIKNLMQEYKEKRKTIQSELKKSDFSSEEIDFLKEKLGRNRQDLENINTMLKAHLKANLQEEFTNNELEDIAELAPNYLFELQQEDIAPVFNPNDPEFQNQWELEFIGIPEGGVEVEGAPKVIVAIIDTGIDYTHEDLQGQFWTSETCVDEFNELIEGGCPNGGYDFVDNDDDPFPSDSYSHGTAVAGIIGANTDNGIGMASLSNNNVEIMALRACCTTQGFFEANDIARAIYFAVNNNANVINMSFGGPSDAPQIKSAIEYAEVNNVLVVAAAGNYAMNNDVSPIYPASYTNENIISVAALDQNTNLAHFSNYGPNTVDIAAPGVGILSAGLDNNYAAVTGTSFATPLTTAALSLYIQKFYAAITAYFFWMNDSPVV